MTSLRPMISLLLLTMPILPMAALAQPGTQGLAKGGTASTGSAPSLESANKNIADGKFGEAIADLRKLEGGPSDSAEIQHALGLAYYKSGRMSEAAQAFARALELNPEDREAVQLRGLALYRSGRPAEAIPLLEQVRQWIPAGSSDVDYILGLCYMDAARYDEARRAFAQQYGVGTDVGASYLIAGQLFLRAHLGPAAEQAGRKALDADPRLPLAHYLLGEIALSRQELPAAIEQFEAERKLNPGNAATYDRLGDAYTRQGHYDEAQAALNRAVILDPARTGPYILLGKVMLRRADAVSAEMYLRRANKMDGNNYMTHALLAQALRTLGRTEEAAREAKIAEGLQDESEPRFEAAH